MVNNHRALRNYIVKHGSYSQEKNLQIYEKWFLNAPRYLFRAVDKKYGITNKVLCDVGCGYGANLFHCASGSFGIEIEEMQAEFARSIGLSVYNLDVIEGDLSKLPKVEVVWCSAVLEHVNSPHIFLRKLHFLMKPLGLLALYVPTIPLFPALGNLPKLGKYVSGYAAKDHVNAFVPSTLQYFCEWAGFRTIEISPFYPGLFKFFNHVPLVNRFTGRIVYIGQKTEQ